jgi:hypothetical protein
MTSNSASKPLRDHGAAHAERRATASAKDVGGDNAGAESHHLERAEQSLAAAHTAPQACNCRKAALA